MALDLQEWKQVIFSLFFQNIIFEGNYEVVEKLEKAIARHVGKEEAMVFGMGYATNSTTLPAVCGGKGCLIISDALNHNSIVGGARDSGAKILVFRHNGIRVFNFLLVY